MRTLAAVVLTAVALIGCNPEIAGPDGETVASIATVASAPPDSTCYWLGDGAGPQPLVDRWNGQKGFVFYHLVSFYCDGMYQNDYGVVGLDPTMTKVIFATEVADMDGVNFYKTLPGTLSCTFKCDAGQVGTQNTDTGGHHQCGDTVCIPNREISALHNQCCNPLPAAQACANAGADCGTIDNGCGTTVSCGTCRAGSTCQYNTCEKSCSITRCPKGSYRDPDGCDCIGGLPQ